MVLTFVKCTIAETFARRGQPWKGLSQEEARGTIKSVLDVLAKAYDTASEPADALRGATENAPAAVYGYRGSPGRRLRHAMHMQRGLPSSLWASP